MAPTSFTGVGVGIGAGIGCGFGIGWGFGGSSIHTLGLGIGGGCGVGVGLGWGFGSAYGSRYFDSKIRFEGVAFEEWPNKQLNNKLHWLGHLFNKKTEEKSSLKALEDTKHV